MQQVMIVKENRQIADQVFELVLKGDTKDITMPGQFVNISLPGFFLRRPISVCDRKEDELTLIYKVVGKGTDLLSTLTTGTSLDILSGLGHGFEAGNSGNAPLLVGGGVGTPPMYGLAKRLVLAGKPVNVILGFGSATDAFYLQEFDALNELYDFGCEGFEGKKPEVKVYTATVDGSLGRKGFVTDWLDEIKECSYYYACGPIPMLKALKSAMSERFGESVCGELSLEERMGCGFGACVGCSVMTAEGAKKVCSDGPVFEA
ncbi:MAG: dihydroorotate dehydrogenase electron transfer subunit, partial [Lachnospiraceae bacterium]|nr:dihydroorotate dehydrogenase electron transfer subunit [Lachnospiraceae bacterium]